MKDASPVDTQVTIGLKADDGQVEILSGLNEGDEVVLAVKESAT